MSSQPVPPDVLKSRTYSGVPQQERARLRRERLIESAIEVFGRLGLAKTTMRDICAQARLSDRYFYESFRNTQEVFDTVGQQLIEQLMMTISGAVMQAPPNEKAMLTAGLRAFLQFIKDDPRRVQIVLVDGVWMDQMKTREGKSELITYRHVIQTLTQGFYPRLSADIDINLAASGLVGTAIHTGIAWAQSGFKADIESVLTHNLTAWAGLKHWMKVAVPKSDAAPAVSNIVEHVLDVFRPANPG
jgi:AcrR family transcriptional regulator